MDAKTIYLVAHDQPIVGPNGQISVSHEAIHRAMELYQIEDKIDCFEKVVSTYRALIERQREA